MFDVLGPELELMGRSLAATVLLARAVAGGRQLSWREQAECLREVAAKLDSLDDRPG